MAKRKNKLSVTKVEAMLTANGVITGIMPMRSGDGVYLSTKNSSGVGAVLIRQDGELLKAHQYAWCRSPAGVRLQTENSVAMTATTDQNTVQCTWDVNGQLRLSLMPWRRLFDDHLTKTFCLSVGDMLSIFSVRQSGPFQTSLGKTLYDKSLPLSIYNEFSKCIAHLPILHRYTTHGSVQRVNDTDFIIKSSVTVHGRDDLRQRLHTGSITRLNIADPTVHITYKEPEIYYSYGSEGNTDAGIRGNNYTKMRKIAPITKVDMKKVNRIPDVGLVGTTDENVFINHTLTPDGSVYQLMDISQPIPTFENLPITDSRIVDGSAKSLGISLAPNMVDTAEVNDTDPFITANSGRSAFMQTRNNLARYLASRCVAYDKHGGLWFSQGKDLSYITPEQLQVE